MGKTPPRKEVVYWDNAIYPWVSIADMRDNDRIITTREKVNQYAFLNIFKGNISKAGTLLMSFKLTVGKVSILSIDAFHNEAIISIYPHYVEKDIQRNYLFKFLPLLTQFGKTKTAIKGNTLNSDSIDTLLIPLPPVQEQARIVACIERLEPFIEEYNLVESELSKLNENFPEQIKKSILQYAIQGKLVPQDPKDEPASVLLEKIEAEKQKLIKAGKIKKDKVESYIYKRDNRHYEKMGDKEVDITDKIPFEIPNSWVWVRLGNVVNYGETPTVSYPQCQNKNMWILDLEDIEKDTSKLLSRYRIKDKKFNSTKKTFCKGNVLYCKLRPYLNKVMVADEDGICTSEIMPLQIYYGIVPEYLKECLKSPYFYQYVNSLTYGIKMPRLGTTNGKRSLIPLPPIQEQQRIVEKIEQLFKILP